MRSWPDGAVVFNARESTTSLLSVPAGEIVARLKQVPLDTRALCEVEGGPPHDEQSMIDLLAALADHGFVRALD